MITSKQVTGFVGDSTVTIGYYTADNRITMTVNGTTCPFPTYYSNDKSGTGMVDTIQALKEAVAAL